MIERILSRFAGLNIIKTENKLRLRLAKFGSLVSGFASGDADLDLTILTNCYVKEQDFLKILHSFMVGELKE